MAFEDASKYHVYTGGSRPRVADLRDRELSLWNPVTGVVVDFWGDPPTTDDAEGGFVVTDPDGGRAFAAVACAGWTPERVTSFLEGRPHAYGASGDCSWSRDVEGPAPEEVESGELTTGEFVARALGETDGWVAVRFDPHDELGFDNLHDFDDVRAAAQAALEAAEAMAPTRRQNWLREARRAAGYDLASDFALTSGMDPKRYLGVEFGHLDKITADEAEAIAIHLGVAPGKLLKDASLGLTTGDLNVPLTKPSTKQLISDWRASLLDGWLRNCEEGLATITEVVAAKEELDAHIVEWFGRDVSDMGDDFVWSEPCPGGHLQVLSGSEPGEGRAELYVEYKPEGTAPKSACRLVAVEKTSEEANRDAFGGHVYATTLHTSTWDGHCDEPVATTCYDENGPEAVAEASLGTARDSLTAGGQFRKEKTGREDR